MLLGSAPPALCSLRRTPIDISYIAFAVRCADIASVTSCSPLPLIQLPATCPSMPEGSNGSKAVVHLMVHKSAKVKWHHMSEDKFELSISSSETVDSLMRKIEAANGLVIDTDRHQLAYGGQVLCSGKPLASYGIGKGSVLQLVPLEPEQGDCDALPDGSPRLDSPAHGLHQHWQRARAGLAEGVSPRLAQAGTGGSYFLQDVDGNSVAVFKPEDEEPLAVNNPKGNTDSPDGEGMRKGTRPGEGAVREVAAYVLDHDHFAGVPPTALVTCFVNAEGGVSSQPCGERKVGSLQQFVVAESDCEERGPSAFPVSEVHKICVLDIRLANTDRNGGNILARRTEDGSSWELVPIDHGYCLPASFEDISFEWMYWPQAEQPFDEATRAYIAQLDADKDIQTLQAHGLQLRPECLCVLRVCTMLLKKAAAAGLSPYQIGCIMSRQALTKCPLEKLHANAVQLAAASSFTNGFGMGFRAQQVDDKLYLDHMGKMMDEYLEEFLLEGQELMF